MLPGVDFKHSATFMDLCCIHLPNFRKLQQFAAELFMIQQVFTTRFPGGGAVFV